MVPFLGSLLNARQDLRFSRVSNGESSGLAACAALMLNGVTRRETAGAYSFSKSKRG